ncbi:MAG: bifunctional phosphoglucose/phosphomannose isomerase [bacterium]|nr:bifunctional phosphoglucose/phosphomannose isomerase [bacterium]
MLDDLKYIHQKDAQDALGIAEKQWQQLQVNFEVKHADNSPHDHVVIAGMGGSALGAQFVRTWLEDLTIPVQIVRDYNIPNFVNKKTLFIASSYSGNTEETLSALAQAEKKGALIAVVSSGGKLDEIAKTKHYPHVTFPSGLQPRFAFGYSVKALTTLLEAYGVTKNKTQELEKAADFVKEVVQDWIPTVHTEKNLAKQIALDVVGRSMVVYSGPKMSAAAYKWKISFNENAKNVAWTNQYPEFSHNEFLGWTSHPIEQNYSIIDIRSSLEHPQIQKRFEVTEKMLSGKRPHPIIVKPKGETLLEQQLYAVILGDFVTLYTALLNGLNPTPVDLIEKMKKELAK